MLVVGKVDGERLELAVRAAVVNSGLPSVVGDGPDYKAVPAGIVIDGGHFVAGAGAVYHLATVANEVVVVPGYNQYAPIRSHADVNSWLIELKGNEPVRGDCRWILQSGLKKKVRLFLVQIIRLAQRRLPFPGIEKGQSDAPSKAVLQRANAGGGKPVIGIICALEKRSGTSTAVRLGYPVYSVP